jgi:ABC-2 type transport system permease protein
MLFLLLIINGGEYSQYAVAGSLVMTMVAFGLALGEDVSYYRLDYRMQDMFVASPVSQFSFMIGLALSELLFGLPAILILLYLTFYFGDGNIIMLPIIIFSSILIWGTMSGLGFFVASFMSHTRNVRQLISFITILVAVIPPIFYSISILPEDIRYIAYGLPTTHASLVIQYAMGFSTPPEWSIYIAFLIQGVYLFLFLGLASKRAVWRES